MLCWSEIAGSGKGIGGLALYLRGAAQSFSSDRHSDVASIEGRLLSYAHRNVG
jgi:hypothetical protein